MSRRLALALLLVVSALGGCASLPPGDLARGDPWERVNRQTFAFNEAVDRVAVKPAAELYQAVVPGVVRQGVDNVFGNVGDAWTTINLFLQAKPVAGVKMGMRTATNTVLGVGGLFDVAEEAGLERFTSEDLGQTFGFWGIKSGPYLVLPLLGPSTLRDTAARLLEVNDAPISRVWDHHSDYYPAAALQLLNTRAKLLNAGRVFDQIALDKYVLLRDAYLSRRRSQIYDGEPPEDGSSSPEPFKKQMPPW